MSLEAPSNRVSDVTSNFKFTHAFLKKTSKKKRQKKFKILQKEMITLFLIQLLYLTLQGSTKLVPICQLFSDIPKKKFTKTKKHSRRVLNTTGFHEILIWTTQLKSQKLFMNIFFFNLFSKSVEISANIGIRI